MQIPPTGETSGWYIWAGEYSYADDFSVLLHAVHLAEWAPLVVKYLGLAPGWSFTVTEDFEDVWNDDDLLGADRKNSSK
jgi:hypothetical protein